MEQLVTINLFGQPYTFKAQNDIDSAQAVADYLVREVARIEKEQSQRLPSVSKLTILILAALNIANQNMELKEKHSDLLRKIYKRSTSLLKLLETAPYSRHTRQVGNLTT